MHFQSVKKYWFCFFQVLKGDIKPAIETHEMLYQITQRHHFLPEAFTVDFQVTLYTVFIVNFFALMS